MHYYELRYSPDGYRGHVFLILASGVKKTVWESKYLYPKKKQAAEACLVWSDRNNVPVEFVGPKVIG